MKYIKYNLIGFVIFPEMLLHSDVHKSLSTHDELVSAGFVEMNGGEFVCSGKSESLKIGSLREDSFECTSQLGHGYE